MESLTGMNIYAVRLLPSRLALVKQCIQDILADQHKHALHMPLRLRTHLLSRRRQAQEDCYLDSLMQTLACMAPQFSWHVTQHLSAVPCRQPDSNYGRHGGIAFISSEAVLRHHALWFFSPC